MQFGFIEMWNAMGPIAKAVVITLVLMSIAAFTVGVDRLFVLLRPRKKARTYAAKIEPLLRNAELDKAAKADTSGAGPLAAVVGAGLDEWKRAAEEAPTRSDLIASVEGAVERSLSTELAKLKRGLGVLATIGSIAPFVGLFGTVMGIVNAFQEMARTGSGGLGAVSAGISEALVTTALGILVAIPAVVLFNWLTGQIETTQSSLLDAASTVLDLVRKKSWGAPQAGLDVSGAVRMRDDGAIEAAE